MSAINLFTSAQIVEAYEQAELHRQFQLLARAIDGQFNPLALKLAAPAQELIGNIQGLTLPGEINLIRDWVIHINCTLRFITRASGQLRFSNIYGATTGVPLLGPSRLESNWPIEILTSILPQAAYHHLARAQEPFTLLISKGRVTLSTYRFYQHDFYLAALDFLVALAKRCCCTLNSNEKIIAMQRLLELPSLN